MCSPDALTTPPHNLPGSLRCKPSSSASLKAVPPALLLLLPISPLAALHSSDPVCRPASAPCQVVCDKGCFKTTTTSNLQEDWKRRNATMPRRLQEEDCRLLASLLLLEPHSRNASQGEGILSTRACSDAKLCQAEIVPRRKAALSQQG